MARKQPTPISLKKPSRKKAAAPVKAFNKDAPEHREPARLVQQVVNKTVKDKALEARVAVLEGAGAPEVIVNLPVRPRIEEITIKYDPFGQPISLVPSYGE